MRFSTRQIAFVGVLGAITVALGFSPVAFIKLPGISVTTMHIPTILAGVIEGPLVGGVVGAMFGAFSMYQAQIIGSPLEKIAFANPVIAVLPRILVGVVSYYVFALVKGTKGRIVLAAATAGLLGYTGYSLSGTWAPVLRWVLTAGLAVLTAAGVYTLERKYGHGPALAAAAGSLTNTILVLSLLVAFGYLPAQVAWGVGVVNGAPEAAVAVILTTLVYRATQRFLRTEVKR